MSMIINNKIQELMVGYPTVSDKYDIAGATLSGSTNVKFGDLVQYDSGNYKAAAGALAITDIAGFVVATNVKLQTTYGGTVVETFPGEAFNLLVGGYIAIALDSGATTSYITPGAQMAVILATGKVTTIDKATTGVVALPGATFTGTYETQGSTIVAEILVK